jgi:alkylation response protein AidB-like acyl-CoA dehydrogenase
MNFDWSPSQTELFERSLAFARRRIEPHASAERFDRNVWDECGEFGLTGLAIPTKHGGLGLDALSTARVLEAFGQGTADLGLLFSAAAHLFACALPILAHGEPAVVEQLIPALARGAKIGANAMTEPGAGSDTQQLAARAVRAGDSYLLQADKCFVTNAPIADVFLVYATTEPSHGYLGVSAFIVTPDMPGVRVGAPMDKVGLKSSPFGSLYLEDCRVPAQYRVGPEGAGSRVFQSAMAWERACLFGIYLGAMQRQLDAVVEYARERKQFRRPIGTFQAVSHRIANMQLRLESARLLLYRACWMHDQQRDSLLAISLAKVAVSEAAVQSGLDAIALHGGLGMISEAGIERGLRDALASTVFSGTSEIQRNLIARALGL